jgi:uncharacterized membrane protein
MTIDGRDIETSDNAHLGEGAAGRAPASGSAELGSEGPGGVPTFRDFTKLPLFVVAGMFIAGAIVYPMMPQIFPTHWGVSGAPDAWSTKSLMTVFFQPLLALGMYGLLVFVPRLDPKRANLLKSISAYNVVLDVVAVFFAFIFAVTTTAAFNPRMDVGRFVFVGVGLLLMVIGRVMRDAKQNYTLGVRVSWTLADEVVWTKTNRLGGNLFVVTGALTVVSAFLPAPWNLVLLLGSMAVTIVVLYTYSYLLYRSRHPAG